MTVVQLEPAAPDIGRPAIPSGRLVDLPGRGAVFVRELDGPDTPPPLLLLHGAAVTAALNWCTSYGELAQRSRVVSLDHRGHGRSFRTRRRFRLSHAADDAVALADSLGIERFVPIGYSMGGAIAQLIWERHPDRVAGLVLCATWSRFAPKRRRAWMVRRAGTLGRISRLVSSPRRLDAYLGAARRMSSIESRSPWVVAECRSGHVPMMLEGIGEIGRFDSSHWIQSVDVPTGLIVLTEDEVVPASRQFHLASLIPHADVRELPHRHDGCLTRHREFLPVLTDVVDGVLNRNDAAVSPRP